ncbi:MAG: SPOR domain-containing protein [Candidatus Omnitrophica bacterium]|nr:SPOR domain-containing protein [Candidatus Omnitrophota bacterium]
MKTFFKSTAQFILVLVSALSFTILCYPSPLDEAYKDYLSNDYEEALQKARSLPRSDETLYFLGLVYAKIGNLPQAREYLLLLNSNYPRSKLHEQGAIKLADTYFLEGDFTRARQIYEGLARKSNASNYSSLIYLRLSQIAEKEGRWDDKKKYLNIIKEKYPSGSELFVADAPKEQDDFFTIQVGAFSNRKNAMNLKNELNVKYDVYIMEDKNAGYVLYKVRVGKFKDRKEAERMWGRLVKQGYPAKIFP